MEKNYNNKSKKELVKIIHKRDNKLKKINFPLQPRKYVRKKIS